MSCFSETQIKLISYLMMLLMLLHNTTNFRLGTRRAADDGTRKCCFWCRTLLD